jgi:hypothetical protein
MYCPPRFIIVYGASALSYNLISESQCVHRVQTYRGCDDSLVDIDFVHGLLTSSNQDFMDTLRGECHAAQIFHVILTEVTLALARLELVD